MSSRDIGANDADNAEDFELHRKGDRHGEAAANDDAGTEDFELHMKATGGKQG